MIYKCFGFVLFDSSIHVLKFLMGSTDKIKGGAGRICQMI